MKRINLLTLMVALLAGASQTQAEPNSSGFHMPDAPKLIVDTPADRPGLCAENISLNYDDTNCNHSYGLPPWSKPAPNLDAEVDDGGLQGNYSSKPGLFGGYHTIATGIPYLWPDGK